jgi:hypothetical protein
MQRDYLPMLSSCKAPWAWDYRPPVRAAQALLEASALADSVQMPLSKARPVGLAAPVVAQVAAVDPDWCKEAAKLCSLVVGQAAGREVAALAAEEEAEAAGSFVKP